MEGSDEAFRCLGLVDEGFSKGMVLLLKMRRTVVSRKGDWEGYREVGK